MLCFDVQAHFCFLKSGWHLFFEVFFLVLDNCVHFPHGRSEYFQVFGRQRRAVNSIHQVVSLLDRCINYFFEVQNIFFSVVETCLGGGGEEVCLCLLSANSSSTSIPLTPLGIWQFLHSFWITIIQKASSGLNKHVFIQALKHFFMAPLPCLWLFPFPWNMNDCLLNIIIIIKWR